MDKKLLDNMTGQEIKEMVDNEIIDLNELDNTALEKVLNFEIDMLCLGTGDMKTIRQCSRILDERNTSDKLNDAQIMSIVDKTEAEYVTIINKDEQNSASIAMPQRKKHCNFRKMVIIAAVVSLMMLGTALVATAFGFDLLAYFREVVGLPAGSMIERNGITFVNNGQSIKYETIDELIKSEKIECMLPSKMPDDVYVTEVRLINSQDSEKELLIVTNDIETQILIFINYYYEQTYVEDAHILNHNNQTYYIREDLSSAFCYHNNNYYSIKSTSYDDLMIIIKNMKE